MSMNKPGGIGVMWVCVGVTELRARDLNLLIYKYRYSVLLAISCMQLVSRARAAGMRDSCAWYPYTMRMI